MMDGQDVKDSRILGEEPTGQPAGHAEPENTDSAANLVYQGLRVRMLSAFTMEFNGQSIPSLPLAKTY